MGNFTQSSEKTSLCVCLLSHVSRVQLFAILCTVALLSPLSMGFPRHEYWSGQPFPSPGDLPDSGIEPMSLMSPALAGGFFTTSATQETPKALLRSLNLKNEISQRLRQSENKYKDCELGRSLVCLKNSNKINV